MSAPYIDWTISLGTIISIIAGIIGITSAYFALLRQVDTRFASMEATFREKFSTIGTQLTTLLEGDVRELRNRVNALDNGQSEWIKTIRERTHTLANGYNDLMLKVDRLERPHQGDGPR